MEAEASTKTVAPTSGAVGDAWAIVGQARGGYAIGDSGLEAFAQLGTELDVATQHQLDRGQRMVELLKQPQYQPYTVNEQVVSIFAGTRGLLDDVAVADVARFEAALLKHVRDEHPEILEELDKSRDLGDALAEKLAKLIRDFKTQWK